MPVSLMVHELEVCKEVEGQLVEKQDVYFLLIFQSTSYSKALIGNVYKCYLSLGVANPRFSHFSA